MGTTEVSGAAAPDAVIVTVRGEDIPVNKEAVTSWAAFNLFRTIERDEDTFAKTDAVFELVELLSELTADDIAEKCGGERADARDVIAYALEIVKAATPKN